MAFEWVGYRGDDQSESVVRSIGKYSNIQF